MNGSGERFPYPAAGAVVQGLGNDPTRNCAKTDRLLLTDLAARAARADPFRRAFVWGSDADPHTNALRNGSDRAARSVNNNLSVFAKFRVWSFPRPWITAPAAG